MLRDDWALLLLKFETFILYIFSPSKKGFFLRFRILFLLWKFGKCQTIYLMIKNDHKTFISYFGFYHWNEIGGQLSCEICRGAVISLKKIDYLNTYTCQLFVYIFYSLMLKKWYIPSVTLHIASVLMEHFLEVITQNTH